MNRLNVRLLLIVAITLVVLATGVVVVHGIQMSRNADSLITKAEQAKESDELREAVQLYRRYLTYRPDDVDRFADFAMLAAKLAETGGYNRRDFEEAVNRLEQAVRDNRDRTDLRSKLVDLRMLAQQYSSAKEHLVEMKAKTPNDPKIDLRLAQCQVNTGDFVPGMKLLETLVGYDPKTKQFDAAKATGPTETEAYMLLARLLHEKITDSQVPDRKQLATRVVDQMVAVNKDSANAFLGKATYLKLYGGKEGPEAAKVAVNKALELAPEDLMALIQGTLQAADDKDYATAESLLARAIKAHPKNDQLLVYWAKIAAIQGKSDEHKERLASSLKSLPTSLALLELQFHSQLRSIDIKAARATLARLEAAGYYPVLLGLAEAQLLMLEGNRLQASQILEKLRPQVARSPVHLRQTELMLIKCYESLGQPDMALAAAQRLLADDATLLEARLAVASSLLAMRKKDEALSEFELLAQGMDADQLAKNPRVWGGLLSLRMEEQLEKPKDERDWTEVEALIADLKQRDALKEPAATLLQCDLLLYKDQPEQAKQLLSDLRKQRPDDLAVINAQINLALRERKADEAQQIIDNLPADLRDKIISLPMRIQIVLTRGGNRDSIVEQLQALAGETASLPEAGKTRVYAVLANAYEALGERKLAQEQFEKLTTAQPDNVRAQWALFNLAREMGDRESLTKSAAWLDKQFGRESPHAKLARAAGLVLEVREAQRAKVGAQGQTVQLDDTDRGNLQKARDLLREVKNQRPDWHEQPKILAEIDSMEGSFDESIENLRAALRLGPSDTLLVKQLVQLLYMRHRIEEAQAVLDSYGSLGGLEKLEAAINISTGRAEDALQKIEAAVPKDSKNPADHLFYGQMLARVNKGDEAEAAFRRATELAPESSEARMALIGQLIVNKKPSEARKVLQEAQIVLPEDGRALVLAQGYEALGENALAEQYYQTVLANAPDELSVQRLMAAYYLRTNRAEQAKKHLNEILRKAPGKRAERESLAWAKRTTASLLAAEGGYQQHLAAMELLTPAEGEKSSPEDLKVRIALLTPQNNTVAIQQAIRLYDELKAIRPLSLNERMTQARLYEYVGNWPRARDEMMAILGQPKPHPAVYINFIEMLLRRNSVTEAVQWLRSLEAAASPNAPEVVTVRASVLAKQGQERQAAAELMRQIPPQRPVPKEQWPLLRKIASKLEEIQQYDQAERLLRELAKYDDKNSLLLAEFLFKRGKHDEAIELAEQHRRDFPPVTMLRWANSVIRKQTQAATPQQIARIEQWYERAMREDPESRSLKNELAQFKEFQGRYADAEKLYREVYKESQPDSQERASTANNLAYVMAVQGIQFDEALRLVEEAIKYYGPSPDVLDTRGFIFLAKGDAKQALRDFTEATSAPSAYPIKFVHLAMAQAAAKDEMAARRSLEKASQDKFTPLELSPREKERFDALLKQLYKPA